MRFFRMAERRITEGGDGEGVVCFISNYGWLDGLSFTGMREQFLSVFDRIWIDCMNGDKYKTGKLTPDGRPDPSVFSTEKNREGIQVGTAISTLVRRQDHEPASSLAFRHFWGQTKLVDLEETGDDRRPYEAVQPSLPMGLTFAPTTVGSAYHEWPSLPALFPVSFPGVKTSRDDVVVDIDQERLITRMQKYFDPSVGDEEIMRLMPGAMQSSGQFRAAETRQVLLRRGFLPDNIVRYYYRPFDNRWVYWEPEGYLLDRNRAEYFPHVVASNLWLSAGQRNRKEDFYQPQVTSLLADHHIVESNVAMFPAFLGRGQVPANLLQPQSHGPAANESPMGHAYLEAVGGGQSDLFSHIIAVLHAPAFRLENAGALRQDWPRVPLPASPDAFQKSAGLGRRIVALLDVESPVEGVSAGNICHELRPIGPIAKHDGGQVNTDASDLAVTAGWGHAGQGGVTMPARGRLVERVYTNEELAAFREGFGGLDLTHEQLMACLGGTCLDVYLNEFAYWRCVPSRVWSYTIGGYQVIKKWLSYRERPLLGRDLTPEEARYVTEMARRIAAILLLEPALDANYERVKGDTYAWPAST